MDLPRESGGSDLLIAPAPATGVPEEGDLNAYLKELVRRRDANERARLMYVAVTRARRTLWLSGAPKLDVRGAVSPDRRSLLSTLWPALAQRFQTLTTTATAEVAPAPGSTFRRLLPEWRSPAAAAALPLTHLPLAHLALEPPEFSWVGEAQRHVGTLVHAWLARLALGAALPSGAEIAAEADAVRAQLARLGVPERERGAAAALILSAIAHTVADERGRWILDNRHAQAHAELALTGISDGRLRNIIIDRSFVDAQGVRWVIDFKTSRHEGGGLEEFLSEELERYRAQLQSYRGIARALGPEPVRAALYFPLLRAFREL
jgi:ATP-dependent exoDNAse (exonuclease V) beta subunit